MTAAAPSKLLLSAGSSFLVSCTLQCSTGLQSCCASRGLHHCTITELSDTNTMAASTRGGSQLIFIEMLCSG